MLRRELARRDSRRTARFLGAVLLACAALGVIPAAQAAGSGEVGEPVPSYEARLINSDEIISLDDMEGTPLLLNKWATWCRPCGREMPDLQNLYEAYRDEGFEVIGISIDRGVVDGPTQDVADDRGVSYPIWRDGEDLFTPTFRSTGVPESILVDKNGVVVHRWRGVVEDDPVTRELIEVAIASEGNYETVSQEATEEQAQGIGLAVALIAGLLSFISPCVLPLVPSYVAFVTGVSGEQAQATGKHLALFNGLLFVLGFSTIFLLLGASASAVGGALRDNSLWLARIGGALMLFFGLYLLGLLKVPGLSREARLLHRATAAKQRLGHASSYVVGAAFGAGWTPCIGPVLAGILTLAATQNSVTAGMGLLGAYSLGLAVPFLLATVFLDRFILTSRRMRSMMPWVNRISGALLMGLGLLLVTGAMAELSNWFARFMPEGLG